jgi:hypothetical protein
VFYVKNHTSKPAIIQDSDLHDDTVIYRACKPRVRVVEFNVFDEIGSTLLNFRPSGLRVAREIIRRQRGENIIITATDAEFAETLWPDLSEATRINKFVRAKRNLKEDQFASGFKFIDKLPREVQRKEDGSYRGVPSRYRPGVYWDISDDLQSRCNQVGREFLALSIPKSREVQRAILSEILSERGYKKIVRERKPREEKEQKEKTCGSCGCECPGCLDCESKISISSLPSVSREERKTKQDVEKYFDGLIDGLFDNGVIWANLNLHTNDYWQKLAHVIQIADDRLQNAIKNYNAPRTKKAGGQTR